MAGLDKRLEGEGVITCTGGGVALSATAPTPAWGQGKESGKEGVREGGREGGREEGGNEGGREEGGREGGREE